jgi:hypothetical protein
MISRAWLTALASTLLVLCAHSSASAKLHLYAAYGSYANGGVLRFPIVNGLPQSKADFWYACETFYCGGLQLAVSPEGTLYYSDGSVHAFAPGSHQATRTIETPSAPSCYGLPGSYGVAVDAQGTLAAGGVQFYSGEQSYSNGTQPPGCEGVFFYGPHAHGQPNPQSSIPLGSNTKFLTWVPSGDLYVVASDSGEVIQFAHPLNNPKMVAQYQTGYCSGNGAAVDERGTLYVYVSCFSSPPADMIEIFRPGSPNPVRQINLPFIDSPYVGNVNLAVLKGMIYVADQPDGMIDLFDARGSGPQQPVYTLRLPKAGGPLTIGP